MKETDEIMHKEEQEHNDKMEEEMEDLERRHLEISNLERLDESQTDILIQVRPCRFSSFICPYPYESLYQVLVG